MSIKLTLEKLSKKQDLNEAETSELMQVIMSGEATPAQIGATLMGLHVKGETLEEVYSTAKTARQFIEAISINNKHLIDLVGTGGDKANLFNISTLAAFVVAAAGGKVAKHGNKAFSSRSGSADVLSAAGCNLELPKEKIIELIETEGFAFLFAPLYHPAARRVAEIRKELGFRTIFNLLGPLTNPAGVKKYVIGVNHTKWLPIFAEILLRFGTEHALIIHSEDGLDEVSLAAPTTVLELKNNEIKHLVINPEMFELKRQDLTPLKIKNAQDSLRLFNSVINHKPGPWCDIVALNAGLGIYVAGLVSNITEGVTKAMQIIHNGALKNKFNSYIVKSNQ
ncbi:MAG: anthranilate phosphoribosyltransferase [Gammaproteobacteria bacterium]